jgi:ribosomal protein S12 methylthiotransferase accessory factor
MDAPQCCYEFWLGSRELKYSTLGVERSVKPGVTIRRALAVLDTVGVTKVSEITDLDRARIPNFVTVRPHDLGPGISYYNGKGATRSQALAGALMEAIERHAGEQYDGPILTASHYNLRRENACVDPLEIRAPKVRDYSEDLLLEWVLGFDLVGRRPMYAPLNCVMSPYRTVSGMPLFYSSTNGLASGNTRLDALCHALCEVIERDTAALAMAKTRLGPAVGTLLADIGFSSEACPEPEGPPLISLRGLPRPAASLIRKMQRAGLEVQLRNLPSDIGIPTIDCTIVEPQAVPGIMSAQGGCGTHPDARIALTRAVTEAAQSRLGYIHGGREDLPDLAPPQVLQRLERQHRSHTIEFDAIPSFQFPSVKGERVDPLNGSGRRAGNDCCSIKSMILLAKNLPVTQWRRLPPYSRISASSPMSQSRRPLRLLAMPMMKLATCLRGAVPMPLY